MAQIELNFRLYRETIITARTIAKRTHFIVSHIHYDYLTLIMYEQTKDQSDSSLNDHNPATIIQVTSLKTIRLKIQATKQIFALWCQFNRSLSC